MGINMVSAAREVLDAELINGPDEGIEDPDQWSKYEDFKNESEQDRRGKIVAVYNCPLKPDGSYSTTGQLEQLFAAPIDQYTRDEILQKVRSEFMDATDKRWIVRIQVREAGKRGLLVNQLVSVRRGLFDSKPIDESKRTDINDVLTNVSRMLAEANQRTEQMLLRLMDTRNAQAIPARDPMEIAMQMATMMSGMVSSIMSATAARPHAAEGGNGGLLGTLQVLREAKELFSGGAAAGPSTSDTADIIRAVSPLAVPLLTFLANERKKNPAITPSPQQPALPNPAARATQPAPLAGTVEEASPTVEKMDNHQMLIFMKDQLGALADLAATNPDPETVAAQVLENIPDNLDDNLYKVLVAPDWFDQMNAVQPKLGPHRIWFTKVRDAMLASFQEEDSDDTEKP